MVELLQSGEKSGESQQAASSLNALLTGGARKKASVRLSVLKFSQTQYTLDVAKCFQEGSTPFAPCDACRRGKAPCAQYVWDSFLRGATRGAWCLFVSS